MLTKDDITESIVDEVEGAIGHGHIAWDMVDPRDIIAAAVNVIQDRGAENGLNRCATCRWWKPLDEDGRNGSCARGCESPVGLKSIVVGTEVLFFDTTKDFGCVLHEPRGEDDG